MTASNTDIEEGIGGFGRRRQNNLNVIGAERYATAFLRFIQGQCRERASHLSGQERLVFGMNDSADLLAPYAAHTPVHLIASGRSGSSRPR